MNKEFNQNTRTLIVSFVLALSVMVPLRFVEVSNSVVFNPVVLGETIVAAEAKIEAPYDLLESSGSDCLSSEYVDKVVYYLRLEKIDNEIADFESRRCQ